MESIFQTIKEIKLFFANLIVKMTGLNDDQVLIQFPERGMGTQDINTNMIYVDVDDETDIRTIYKNRDTTHQELMLTQLRNRLLQLCF